ncbi:hypothetical protein KJ934_01505 [Patescibacteria group bacterium]|nr:hypothetical protein [Patescibacteria group bacterium]MBU4353569.1 hypothetical protein [Patescibacteria group bacterium]MBU4476923.1 hypothetical protein [Patescibacteria group bacterium]MCG2699057.1 hypothetical protein [Candidatus Parcubacteria bacterium]
MAKKIIQDILTVKKEKMPPRIIVAEPEKLKEEILRSRGRGKKTLKIIFWISLAAIFIALLGMVLDAFASATVKIIPRQEFIAIDSTFKAVRGSEAGDLKFEIAQMDYELSQQSYATGISDGGKKASGRIVIYNQYSSDAQKLVAQTRFESPEGKIYRIQEPVVVPGFGSVEAAVYADKDGEEYNTGLVDFTIPGFKGNPRYEKIYARSKTDIKVKESSLTVTDEDIDRARNSLKKKIEDYLMENILKQEPSGYLPYKDAIKIDFEDDVSNPQTGKFIFKEKGKAVRFLINDGDLSKVLAKKYISENKNADIEVANIENLEFKLISRNADDTEFSFNLKGKAHFVWGVDSSALVNNLMNAQDKDYLAVFRDYPYIEKAELFFKPSWWQTMPKNKSRVHIEIILKNEQ